MRDRVSFQWQCQQLGDGGLELRDGVVLNSAREIVGV
jgi:hypothetical protein